MAKNRFLVVCTLVSLSFPWTCAFIYEVKVLRAWDKQRERYQYVIGCSDFHDKTHDANKAQAAALEALLDGADKKSVKLVLEDLSSNGSSNRNSCGRFVVNSRGGVLGGLATKCRQKGFEVDNVEYRYCRVSSLGPILNNMQQAPHSFSSVKGTQVSALALEVDAVVQEIESYTDGRSVAAHYKQGLKSIKPQLKKWKRGDLTTLNVADYIEKHSTPDDRLEFLKHLLTFDSGLVDLKMIHAIINARTFDCVVAITGGAHISRVSEILQSLGYELVYETDVQFSKEYDLKKCIGSTIVDGTYCVRPEPINLDVITTYL